MADESPLNDNDLLFIQGFTGDFQETAERCKLDLKECYLSSKKKLVRLAILERFEACKNPLIAQRDERLAYWTRVMRAEEPGVRKNDTLIRLRASELLGKAMLDFGEKRIVEDNREKALVPKRELEERIARIERKMPKDEEWMK